MKAIVYSPETAAALDGSIEKWRSIRDGVGEDRGGENCSLCLRFNDRSSDDLYRPACMVGGERCPVFIRTGLNLCDGSPYEDWHDAVHFKGARRATTPELVALAQKELDFLESLKWEKE